MPALRHFFVTLVLLLATRAGAQQYLYAAHKDGSITVHDINAGHALVKTLRFQSNSSGNNVNGICAAVPTHRLYVSYYRSSTGHIACLDLLTGALLWDHTYSSQLDRFDITPDGAKLFVPTYESNFSSPFVDVIDASDGSILTTIAFPICTHDCIVNNSGSTAYLENKKGTTSASGAADGRLREIDTATNVVASTSNQVGGIHVMQPFVFTADQQFFFADVRGVHGFQYASFNGPWNTVAFPSSPPTSGISHPHGIGLKRDGSELWLNDFGHPFVQVYDTTVIPPAHKRTITVPYTTPHWLSMNLDCRFAYVSSTVGTYQPTIVIDTSTYAQVGTIKATEETVEVDFDASGNVVAVGKQISVGAP